MRVCPKCKVVMFSDVSKHVCAEDVNVEDRQCPTCRYVFSSKRNLAKHMDRKRGLCHQDRVIWPKPFKCHSCGIFFTRARDIPRHLKNTCMGTKQKEESGSDVFAVDTDLHIPINVHRPKKPKARRKKK